MTATSEHRPARRLTPARIAALLVIAAAVAWLANLRLSHPDGWAELPAGAHAGQLRTHPCEYPTERGDVAADCGTLVVEENRADPRSRLIALPVTRIRARTRHPAEPVMRLEGGPGISNMTFPYASRFNGDRDVVLVGYRGVDGSARLDCPEVTDARRHAADLLSPQALRASARALRDCAARLRRDGFDLAGYSIASRVDDLEAARRAFGYGRVDLLSESFGTRVALVYSWRHPQSIRRSVMIGANPPGHFVWSPANTRAQLRRLSELCGRGDECRTGHGDLAATMDATAAHMPKRWGPLPVHRGNVQAAAFFGLMESSDDAAPLSAPVTLDSWRAAARGDAAGLWFESFAAALLFPRAQVWGDAAAMARADAAAARRHFAREQHAPPLADAGSRLLWSGGALTDAWPAAPGEDAYSRMRPSRTPTLVVSGELDGATPAAAATRELLPQLRHGRQVVLKGFGHTTDFWSNQTAAGTRLIGHYLHTGEVDASRYVAQRVDFTLGLRQTTLAKGVAGGALLLALGSAAGLAAMVARARRRGSLGRVNRVLARSAWAPAIGLGGWVAAALVVLTAFPAVPVDAEAVLVAAVALPVAPAAHAGWRGPERVAGSRAALAAAAAGALAGAWLGFHAAEALTAVWATLAGAVAGANLALIGADVAAESRERAGAPPAPAPPERRPAVTV